VVEPVAIAVLGKAPIPGLAKTRLIPALGAHGAAALQERLLAHAVATACEAAMGPVALWAAPDARHAAFHELAAQHGIRLAVQPDGDLGSRMLAAIAATAGPVLVIGTDCPALTPDHLRDAAEALRHGSDVTVIPAEDGGYVLIGMRRPEPRLFVDMSWSVPSVMAATRQRAHACRLRLHELPPLWDVDRPEDLARLERDEKIAFFAD
jgi:rSAM/selenodomain-associated transferase 1